MQAVSGGRFAPAEPRNERSMIVRILRNECCGNGTCAELVPAVFMLDSKNKAVVIDAEAADRAKLLEAAEACPCSAIVVEDDEGKALFP
jgi:ferredoxin